jgi:antitoxin (DNA-binding transcriptional repressor) of toxin-antitoxin stability system
MVISIVMNMKYQTVSIAQTRATLAEIIEQVSVGGKTYAVTKFGKVKALITPVTEDIAQDQLSQKKKFADMLAETSGAFKHREDMKDSAEWVRKQRKPRYENIFG